MQGGREPGVGQSMVGIKCKSELSRMRGGSGELGIAQAQVYTGPKGRELVEHSRRQQCWVPSVWNAEEWSRQKAGTVSKAQTPQGLVDAAS